MATFKTCESGLHRYDSSINSKCPQCGASSLSGNAWSNQGSSSRSGHAGQASQDDPTVTRVYGREQDPLYGAGARSGPAAPDPEVTVARWKKDIGIDPVVGWLVCDEGPNQGRDYRLRAGYNDIGRDTSCQVCIAGDETISRKEHAKIFYDHKTAAFHVVPGSGRAGVYVNEQVVLQSALLKPYDRLEIGKTKLVFVPFCGDRFRWDLA